MTEAQILERKIKTESAALAQLGCTPEQIAKHVEPLQRNAADSELARYDAACRAIAEAKAVDEVILIHDQARAMAAAARIAKNRKLEIDAAEIRIRATRRLGQMMEERKQDRAGHGGDRKSKVSGKPLKPTLAEVGIDKSLAHRARKLATHPEKKFEQMVKEWREEAIASNDPVSSMIIKAFWTAQEAKAKKQRVQEYDRQVADFFDAVKMLLDATNVAHEAREKFSPEAVPFTIRKLNALRRALDAFEKDLITGRLRRCSPTKSAAAAGSRWF